MSGPSELRGNTPGELSSNAPSSAGNSPGAKMCYSTFEAPYAKPAVNGVCPPGWRTAESPVAPPPTITPAIPTPAEIAADIAGKIPGAQQAGTILSWLNNREHWKGIGLVAAGLVLGGLSLVLFLHGDESKQLLLAPPKAGKAGGLEGAAEEATEVA